MKRNLYNFKLKDSVGDSTTYDGTQFYNLSLEKEYFNLTCSNGDTLVSVDSVELTAHNVDEA